MCSFDLGLTTRKRFSGFRGIVCRKSDDMKVTNLLRRYLLVQKILRKKIPACEQIVVKNNTRLLLLSPEI